MQVRGPFVQKQTGNASGTRRPGLTLARGTGRVPSMTDEAMRDTLRLGRAVIDALHEVTRARLKHGKQNLRDLGIDPHDSYLLDLGIFDLDNKAFTNLDLEAVAKARCDSRKQPTTWVEILGEEFFEFAAAGNLEDARAEAVQIAAMALSVVTIIDEMEEQ